MCIKTNNGRRLNCHSDHLNQLSDCRSFKRLENTVSTYHGCNLFFFKLGNTNHMLDEVGFQLFMTVEKLLESLF